MKYIFSQKNNGFTLIEVLTTISIVSLLMSIVIVSLASVKQHSQESDGQIQVQKVLVALELYYNATGGYPVSDSLTGNNITADVDGDEDTESVNICCASGNQCQFAGEVVSACAALLTQAPRVETTSLANLNYISPSESPAITLNGEVWQGVMYLCKRPSNSMCPESQVAYLRGLPISGIKYSALHEEIEDVEEEETTPQETNSSIDDPYSSYNSSLEYSSCHEEDALNYDPTGIEDNSLCFLPEEEVGGCTDSNDPYYSSYATYSNGTCATNFYASYETYVD